MSRSFVLRFHTAIALVLSATIVGMVAVAPNVNAATISISQVSVGDESTCAVSSTHVAYCWGHGSPGLIGNNSFNSTTKAAKVALSGVASIAVGARSACAVTTTSKVYCWGDNGDYELARTTPTQSAKPLLIAGLSGVKKVVVGEAHVCTLFKAGNIKCWGLNTYGQLGNGSVAATAVPTSVTGITSAIDIVAGSAHTCAVLSGGSVSCWGWNGWAQIGAITLDDRPHPTPQTVPLASLGTLKSFGSSGSSQHVCGLTSSQQALCWGYNVNGQVRRSLNGGNLGLTNLNLLTGIGASATVTSVSTGIYHTCLVNGAAQVYCQGLNDVGQIGQSPTGLNGSGVVTLSSGARSVAVGQDVTCVILISGALQCFGDNTRGQLGNGTTQSSWIPVNVHF